MYKVKIFLNSGAVLESRMSEIEYDGDVVKGITSLKWTTVKGDRLLFVKLGDISAISLTRVFSFRHMFKI